MSDLSTIRPTVKRRVMDLLAETGWDVSDWANFAGGIKKAAANPRYCYEWAFVAPGQYVVLNVWYRDIQRLDGSLLIKGNLRASAERHSRTRSGSAPVWTKRARRFDEALWIAFTDHLTVRVIICDGEQRRVTEGRASKVKTRLLDPTEWAVTSYDVASGAFTLTRGVAPVAAADQFAIGATPDTPTEQRDVHGRTYVRKPEVRAAVLARAKGRCEWCGSEGFRMDDGRVFLETHHVLPLSEGGPDVVENVVALCPNHHREAHYGVASRDMREKLTRRAAAQLCA